MENGLILVPIFFALVALAIPSNSLRRWVLPLAGLIHLVLALLAVRTGNLQPVDHDWIRLDAPGRLVLLLTSLLSFLCSLYAVGYLKNRMDRSNRIFCTCLLLFNGMMSLVCCSQHLGVLWVAIDATTLVSAPMIYFNRTPRSIEAAWKYLMICSVGIALALLGSFFLAYASLLGGEGSSTLTFSDLVVRAPLLSKPWLHAGLVFLFVGYGTKMGLAPMHTWKPEAYGEAPGVVGALLSGGLTHCAFLAIARIHSIGLAAGDAVFTNRLLIFLGLLSMAFAALFVLNQKDFKRTLAYSSVEQMGILVLGLATGGLGCFGALLHMVNNSLTKGLLFMSAGNIHRALGSKTTDSLHGTLRLLPFSSWMFLLGFLAISGSPPFGPFLSELTILTGMVDQSRYITAGLFLLFLMVVFVGMGMTVLSLVQGEPQAPQATDHRHENLMTVLPMLVLFGLVLGLGLYLPPQLLRLLNEAALSLGGQP